MINGHNTMISLAHVYVRDRDYTVYLSMCTVTRHIHVFKYNDQRCSYEVFNTYSDCCSYLEEPFE